MSEEADWEKRGESDLLPTTKVGQQEETSSNTKETPKNK